MLNTFAIFAMVSGVSWLLGTCTLPSAAYSADAAPAVNSNGTGSSGLLETRRAPVPLVRRVTDPSPSPTPTVEPQLLPPNATVVPTSVSSAAEQPPRGELTSSAAKAAVEADGYKRATLLERRSNGTWQVKAYRGDTEVVVTVDGAGMVTAE